MFKGTRSVNVVIIIFNTPPFTGEVQPLTSTGPMKDLCGQHRKFEAGYGFDKR